MMMKSIINKLIIFQKKKIKITSFPNKLKETMKNLIKTHNKWKKQ